MTPEDFETYGSEVVEEIVRSWTSTYQYHIARLDPEAGAASPACRYVVAFSLPLNAVPVPCDVLRVFFSLVAAEEPMVVFNLESHDLQQYWVLQKDSQTNRWRPVPGQQLISLGFDSFESFIEARLNEKDGSRTVLDLRTPFEESRLLPPPAYSDSEDGEEGDDWDEEGSQAQDNLLAPSITHDNTTHADRELMRSALQAAGLPCDGNLSLPEILASIFDAADETSCGLLHHHEVMQLLTSTLSGLGLELWDIHLLAASAQENAEGLIEYKAFVQAAPEIIEALQFRRLAYKKAGFPKAIVTPEAVQICHGDEIAETVRTLTELFDQCADPNLEGMMTRSCFKDCLACRHDRISPQELQHLMQMMPEDEDGRVTYADLQENLEMLRVDSLHNALVETDIASLRKHIILLLRRQGLNADCSMYLWNLKRVLLQADQLCLSRLQIHVLLCMTSANMKGMVNCYDFLQVCCAVIPHMFSSELFVAFAANVANEQADATKRAELAELEAMTKGMTAAAGGGEEEEKAPVEEAVAEVDREQVEKSLTHAFSLLDDGRRGVLSAETLHKVLTSADAQVQGCQLSDAELVGLAAEMSVDQNGDVAYKEHVQTWVPILFELRKSRLYETYLVKEPFKEIKKPDLTELEKQFPVLPPELTQIGERRGSRRHSKGSKPSKECDEDGESGKRSRLRRSDVARESTSSAVGQGSSNLHMLRLGKMNRSPEEGVAGTGSKMIQRKSTLEGKRTISLEEQPPVYGVGGRGEERRRQRGLIPEPIQRRSSKRLSSKDPPRRASSKDASGL
jgi:Ca2+-binding EF-hand superfamily protein